MYFCEAVRGAPSLSIMNINDPEGGALDGGLNVTLTIRLLMHGKVRPPNLFFFALFTSTITSPLAQTALLWG